MGRQPAHDSATGGLEPVNGLLRLLGRIGTSAEAKTPDGDDGFAVVVEVGGSESLVSLLTSVFVE